MFSFNIDPPSYKKCNQMNQIIHDDDTKAR